MKAVAITQAKQVEIIDVAEPTAGPEDVLLDIQYVGLCGSDLNAYRGNFALVSYPLILGHELSAVVVDKGAAVPDSIDLGNRVTVLPYTHCGVCPACRAGRFNCCQFNQTLGVQRPGALSERFSVPYPKVFKSDSLTPQELALVEPMSVGYHAANRGEVSEMDTVLAIGCGTIGMGVIAAAARKGATVVAVDVDDDKLALAAKFGASHTLNSARTDVLAAVGRLTDDEGVRVAIEAVGLPDTYRLAVEAVCYAGRVVYVGYAKKEVCYDTTDFVRKELDIRGSRNALRVFPAVIQMIEGHEYPFSELITAVYPLERAGQALEDWDRAPGRYNKILVDVSGGS
jgi:threonine dehydrogenase-like Zn-dependent dehydrogenase